MGKYWREGLCIGVLALGLGGCSLGKDTHDMKQTTQQLKTSTDQVKQTSTSIADNTTYLRNDLTAKESYAVVTANLDRLFAYNSDTGTDLGTTADSTMLDYAKATVMAMWFQYWKGDYSETDLSTLDARFAVHIELLFGRCLEHIPDGAPVNPKTIGVVIQNPDGFYKAIASLGAFLDAETDEYAQVLKARGLEHMSLYDVIVQALRDRNQSTRAELLPKATEAVLHFAKEATYMLQLRQNYLPMMVVGRMVPFGPMDQLHDFMFGTSVDLGFGDATDPSKPNIAELQEWTDWLNSALQTRADLKSVGIAPEYDDAFMTVLNKIDFGQNRLVNLAPNQLSPRQKALRDFALAFNKVAHP